MPVQALQCKECDSTYPLDARYVCEQCFGPLEVAYDFSGVDAADPTHSFKDRVVAVALAKARELGYEVVACASTGNLANAVAAHAAAAGPESYVFIPAHPEG